MEITVTNKVKNDRSLFRLINKKIKYLTFIALILLNFGCKNNLQNSESN